MSAKGVSSFVRRNCAAIGGMAVLCAAMAASLYVQGPNSPELTLSDLANLDGDKAVVVERPGIFQATASGTATVSADRHDQEAEARP